MNSVGVLVLVMVVSAPLQSGTGPARRARHDRRALRIFEGIDDTAGKYPYVVALLFINIRMCTGTLITPMWVLTAAHCKIVDSIQYGNMTVLPQNIQTKSKLLKFIPHQSYRGFLMPGETHCDIGMLLVEETPLKVYGKLAAVDYRALTGHQVEYAGYGGTGKMAGIEGIKEDLMRPLQLADGVVVSCTANYDLVTPCMCVAPRCARPQFVLPGDSGGPVFLDGKVVGVAHALVTFPAISLYVPVSPYLTWIQQVMEEQHKINKYF